MKEIVILSGKGGTGKTSLTASFASLANKAVFADCDVDAADLHLILQPDIQTIHTFTSGHEAVIRTQDCSQCDVCTDYCRFGAIQRNEESGEYRIDPIACEGCGVCVHFCPDHCIDFPIRKCGEWYHSNTRFGPMVHAHLGIAAENSGKLVSLVRQEAKKKARQIQADVLLVDGPPGIGCPAIASITGADFLVLVTEPTLSGKHDIERVLQLAKHFSLPASIVVNKWDINPDMTAEIEGLAAAYRAHILGRIRYDKAITQAQIEEKSVIELGESDVSKEIQIIWNQVQAIAC
ncbi:(4Fe-4S)-binding protein [Vibrio sp. V27_P1S3P104]|nr:MULTISPECIES: ATP-binding protein [unclassified Vibrio]NAW69722.1 (4Fe-4S)-binding protein [Vibrio sp. V28_P6S34P95]NAX06287.1 (4Fe-4S)-binding protein [Vibrio sp. V30_P3S12P165]NAX34886.1 (4Fe-4S)-binding protein [Vibrio sp. V29_P1S30P107]NAX37904.1 (4Fe-4S)-binding protein [Vibrio sp. V27_P1S3P104]